MSKLELTAACNDVLNHARTKADEFRHGYVTTEHVFISLLEKSEPVKEIFKTLGIDSEDLRKIMVKDTCTNQKKSRVPKEKINFSPKISRVITIAGIAAKRHNSPVIGTHHLLLGIIDDDTGLVPEILERCGININDIHSEVLNAIDPEALSSPEHVSSAELEPVGMQSDVHSRKMRSKGKRNSILDIFSTDLTSYALNGKIDPIIGRDDEIDQAIQILLRRQKNNPMLIGHAGVGKTAIAEALALRIVKGEVPEKLVNTKIYAIDMGSIVAGTKYRGQFEERLKSIIEELTSRANCIAFIDEFHTVVGSGNSEGSLDACNILKPALSRGDITIIGATTYDEYRMHIEDDSALVRRFQNISVDEPTSTETYDILNGIKDQYEKYHNVKYKVEAIKAIINLSERYITDRNFPDKAIDLMDQAGAKSRSSLLSNEAFDPGLEREITDCENLKEKFVKNKKFEEAAECRAKQSALEAEYENNFKLYEKKLKQKISITSKHIEQLVSQHTGIPCEKLDNNSITKLKEISSFLKRKVIGQGDAITTICDSIKRSRVGLSDGKCPVGTFLFLGPTGVGKTYLAKCLSEFLFDDADKIIRLDMSEYMEGHSVSKLIGSPPGYVGYEDGGKLTEAVRRDPYSIVLFDEIEKAHDDVYNLLLQLLDEGTLTDAHGNAVNFKNCIIIMTSNIGANLLQKNNTMGFLSTEYNDVHTKVMAEVEKSFKPEFINRLDEIAIFDHLNKKELLKVITYIINELKSRLKLKNINLSIDGKVKDFLIDKGYDPKYGARPLKRAVKNYLESPLADFIINNNLTGRQTIKASMSRTKIKLSSNTTEKGAGNCT